MTGIEFRRLRENLATKLLDCREIDKDFYIHFFAQLVFSNL